MRHKDRTCPACGGSGQNSGGDCGRCLGTGEIRRPPRRRGASLLAVPLALVSLLATTAAGCGSSGGSSSGSGKSALSCNFDTELQAPVKRQLLATSSVYCDFPVESATTTLVIQARKTGESNLHWDNVDDPKTTTGIPPNQLSYTVVCVGGLDYQASADITGIAADGKAFHADETTDVVSYTQAECNQS